MFLQGLVVALVVVVLVLAVVLIVFVLRAVLVILVLLILLVVLIVFVVLLVRHFNSPLKNCISTKSLRDDVHIFCAGMRSLCKKQK